MKSLLLLFIIIQCYKLTIGQNYDSGRISTRDGKCLTMEYDKFNPLSLSITSFKTCDTSNKLQEFDFNFGSWSLPTFVQKGTNYSVGLSYDRLYPKIPTDFDKHCWTIKNADKDEFYIMETFHKVCMTIETEAYIGQCKEISSQAFKFISSNPNDQTKVTYRADYIPLNAGNFLDANATLAPNRVNQGFVFSSGGYKLKFENCNLRVFNPSNQSIWSLYPNDPTYCPNDAYLTIQPDNNVCIYVRDRYPGWCSFSNGSGGRYFVFIPPYSYAREFGIVVLNEKKQMVWGEFGSGPLSNDAKGIIIPSVKT